MLEYNCAKKEGEVVNRIKELRKKKGMSIDQLSKELNKKGVSISPASISKYEREERKPKIDKWVQLADFFDVPINYLQGISDYTNADNEKIKKLEPLLYDKDGKLDKNVLYKIADIDASLSLSEAIKQDFVQANKVIDILFSHNEEEKRKYKKVISNSEVPDDNTNVAEPVSSYNFLLVVISEMFLNAQCGDDIAKGCLDKLNKLLDEYDSLIVHREHKKYLKKKKGGKQ